MGWAEDLFRKVQAAERRARVRLAAEIAHEQQRLIDSEETPSGGSQKTGKKKTGTPLVKTGVLRDASQWRIEDGPEETVLRPPVTRARVIHILDAQDYETVLRELPSSRDFARRLQQIVDEEMAKG